MAAGTHSRKGIVDALRVEGEFVRTYSASDRANDGGSCAVHAAEKPKLLRG